MPDFPFAAIGIVAYSVFVAGLYARAQWRFNPRALLAANIAIVGGLAMAALCLVASLL